MSEKHQFLISFISDGQPWTEVINANEETLDVDAAIDLLKVQRPDLDTAALTDVQVQKRTRTEQADDVPGHYQQP